MNAGQAKTALMAYGFDTNDPLLQWLDTGKTTLENAEDWPFLRKTVIMVVNAGDFELSGVDLPADFFKVMSIRDIDSSRKLTYMDPLAFDRDIENPFTPGSPSIYTVVAAPAAPGWAITLWPVPDAATNIQLRYEAILTDITGLADGTALPGPVMIHFPIVQCAAVIALQVDNEEDRAATAQAASNEAIAHLRRRMLAKIDEAETVQNVQGY